MEKDFNADQWEWSKLRDQSEKHLKEQTDKLFRCIERARQCAEREADASYKALTCTRDREYLLRDHADASQSMRDCLEILTEEIPVSIDLLQTALCKGLME